MPTARRATAPVSACSKGSLAAAAVASDARPARASRATASDPRRDAGADGEREDSDRAARRQRGGRVVERLSLGGEPIRPGVQRAGDRLAALGRSGIALHRDRRVAPALALGPGERAQRMQRRDRCARATQRREGVRPEGARQVEREGAAEAAGERLRARRDRVVGNRQDQQIGRVEVRVAERAHRGGAKARPVRARGCVGDDLRDAPARGRPRAKKRASRAPRTGESQRGVDDGHGRSLKPADPGVCYH